MNRRGVIALVLLVLIIMVSLLVPYNPTRADTSITVAPTTTMTVEPTPTVIYYKAPHLYKGMPLSKARSRIQHSGKFHVVTKKVYSWKYKGEKVMKWKYAAAQPTTSTPNLYAQDSTITVWYGKKPPKPKHVDNGKYGVEKWRDLIAWHMYNRGCYNERVLNKMLKYCIKPESGGRAVTHGGLGSSDGLCQYISTWDRLTTEHCCKNKLKNYRECGDWSIWRMVRGYDLKGEAFLRATWVNYP